MLFRSINYFLMCYFEKDPEGMSYLFPGLSEVSKDEKTPYYSMHKNTIEEKSGGYACHSLIESNGKYTLFNTFFSVEDLKITDFGSFISKSDVWALPLKSLVSFE